MAPSRRGTAQRLSVAGASPQGPYLPDLPPVSALFLIDFDVRAGYTIVWKQSVPGIELEGLVEYKSLPSGLHTVKDDLIYFVHEGGHAGLSAFVNTPCDEEEARNARMIAVGILVPLSYGRLGRAWRHAEGLKEMAARLAEDKKDVAILEQYWEKNKAGEDPAVETPDAETPLSSPSINFHPQVARKGHTRNRSASDGAALLPPNHRLSPYHPAWSLTNLLDTFGPLIFPIHRAALLRKRILISCSAPVHEVCNFVYDLSVLSNIPLSVAEILSPPSPTQRLRPLFTIGVHDMPFLVEDYEASKRNGTADHDHAVTDDAGTGWIACTTDSILAMKGTLWDMLITLPPAYSSDAKEKVWPTVEWPQKVPIKASQRDLRRFRALRAGLARLTAATPAVIPAESPQSESSTTFRLSTSTATTLVAREEPGDDAMEKAVEPLSWAALAYSGFMWWASAGEQGRADEAAEAAEDALLLADLAPPPGAPSMLSSPPPPGPLAAARTTALGPMTASVASLAAPRPGAPDDEARPELATITYFHRLTMQMLAVLANAVDAAADSEEDDEYDDDPDASDGSGAAALLRPGAAGDGEGRAVRVTSRTIEAMGLDVWSRGDVEFVRQLTELYFGRRAYIEGKGVEVCGVRVC